MVERERQQRLELFAEVARRHEQTNRLTRDELMRGFTWGDEPMPVVDYSRGIRNPRGLLATLAVVSNENGPYADRFLADGTMRYAYQGTTPGGDNAKLRRAFELGLPIILFLRQGDGDYLPVWPVYVVADDPVALFFTLSLEEAADAPGAAMSGLEKRYREQLVRQRVHQPLFRHQVLHAYAETCAVCQLQLPRLLDAAHIIEDSRAGGIAAVPNGMALCKIHHAAYDDDVIGVDPDYKVHVNTHVLEIVDGPMMTHGLQEMHGREIIVPAHPSERPDRARLADRFERFLRAG